jgi:hypothetical protein
MSICILMYFLFCDERLDLQVLKVFWNEGICCRSFIDRLATGVFLQPNISRIISGYLKNQIQEGARSMASDLHIFFR